MKENLQRILLAMPDCFNFTDDLSQSINEGIEQGADLTDILSTLAKLAEKDIIAFYAHALELDILDQNALMALPISNSVNIRFLHHHNVLAFDTADGNIKLVTTKPYDSYPFKAISLATEKKIIMSLSSSDSISFVLHKITEDSTSIQELSEQITSEELDDEEDDIDRLKSLASGAPIVRLVDLLIIKALELRASDIHIEPFEKKLRVRYRIDGALREIDSPPLNSRAAIISRIKIMARLDISERRVPQDGRIQMNAKGHQLDLRISTIPSLFGESVVLRILDKEQLNLDFEKLGFGKKNINKLMPLIKQPHGIILVTGPTGSGKTTTLYTALSDLNSPNKKIMTVEDPIEYQLDGIMQMQVNPNIGLGFSNALRALVRQDPDILMIGEMRDYETASIAIQSALTGHLVLSTLHTNDAGSAITRLMDMGVKDYLITSTVTCVVAQRLVKTLCKSCMKSVTPLPELFAEFKLDQYNDPAPVFFEPVGCSECDNLGYKGRSVILEQMVMDDSLRTKILAHVDGTSLQAQAISSGMRTMREDGIEKALAGITSLHEVISATQDN